MDVGYPATQLGGQLYGGEFDGVAVAGRPDVDFPDRGNGAAKPALAHAFVRGVALFGLSAVSPARGLEARRLALALSCGNRAIARSMKARTLGLKYRLLGYTA